MLRQREDLLRLISGWLTSGWQEVVVTRLVEIYKKNLKQPIDTKQSVMDVPLIIAPISPHMSDFKTTQRLNDLNESK